MTKNCTEITTEPGAASRLHPAVTAALRRLDIPYQAVDCDPELADTAVFCEHYGYRLDQSANTLVVAAKSGEARFAACLLLATCRLDVNRCVRKRLGTRRISFASAEDTMRLTGMELGGVTPLALPERLPLWIDEQLMMAERVILGGGNRSSKLIIAPQALLRLANASVVPGLALAPPP